MNNIKTYILSLLFVMVGSLSAMADNVVSITGFDIVAGETKELAINLANTDPVSTLQIEFSLPEGLTVNEVEGDKFIKVNRAIRHSLTAQQKGTQESYQIWLTSTTLREMAAGDAAVVTFEVTAAADFNPISFITLDRVIGGNKTNEKLIYQDTEYIVNEKAHFVLSANEAISGKAGDIIPVTVNLENKVQVSQMQAKIVLPEGLKIVPDAEDFLYTPTTRTSNFEVDGAKVNDTDYTLLITTTTKNSVFKGSEGAIFTFNVKATKGIENANIQIKDVACSTTQAVTIKVDGIEIPVSFQSSVDLNNDGKFNMKDVQLAFDIYMENKEGVLPDFNGDGKSNMKDVQWLYNKYMND